MELQGKKVVFLGDSITEGTGASCVENGYISVFGKISGADVKKFVVGAEMIANRVMGFLKTL